MTNEKEIKKIRKKLEELEKKQEEEKEEKLNDDNRYAKEVDTKGWVD